LRKDSIILVMSVFPSSFHSVSPPIRPHAQARLPQYGFAEKFYIGGLYEFFFNMVKYRALFIKIQARFPLSVAVNHHKRALFEYNCIRLFFWFGCSYLVAWVWNCLDYFVVT